MINVNIYTKHPKEGTIYWIKVHTYDQPIHFLKGGIASTKKDTFLILRHFLEERKKGGDS